MLSHCIICNKEAENYICDKCIEAKCIYSLSEPENIIEQKSIDKRKTVKGGIIEHIRKRGFIERTEPVSMPVLNYKAKKVIDIGCGYPEYYRFIDQEYDNLLLVDFDKEFIYKTKNIFNDPDKVKFLVHDANNPLPFGKNSFDIVISLSILQHIKNYNMALSEMHRILKPGGYILLGCHNSLRDINYLNFWKIIFKPVYFYRLLRRRINCSPEIHDKPFTPGQLKKIMKSYGFKILKHASRTFYYSEFPYYLLFSFIDKYKITLLQILLKKFIDFNNKILHYNIPYFKWGGFEQYIVAQKNKEFNKK